MKRTSGYLVAIFLTKLNLKQKNVPIQILDVTMKNLPASIVVKDVLNNFSYIYRNPRN